MKFQAFSKIPRLSRECIITEKIDGTNAQIAIFDICASPWLDVENSLRHADYGGIEMSHNGVDCIMVAGSRTRWIAPGKDKDNFGFAGWVRDNKDELIKLGPGIHYGEWWGQGIQRGYGLKEKRFSLFNTARWGDPSTRPACCDVVPTLYTGMFDTDEINHVLEQLAGFGSAAAPGYMNPEGIVIYHVAGGYYFKKTIEKDESPKGLVIEEL